MIPVTLAMVLRDEEAGVARAIESALPYVSEVVCIIDERTSDGTVLEASNAARSAGVPLDFVTFDVDTKGMGEARNASFDMAENDWVFVLDGDEFLETPGSLFTDTFLADDELDLVACILKSVQHGHDTAETGPQPRLFRRSRVKWKYPIHNQSYGWRPGHCGLAGDAVVVAEYDDNEATFARSVPILNDMLGSAKFMTEEGQDEAAHALYYLAKHHAVVGHHEEAAACARSLVEMRATDPKYRLAWVRLLESTARSEGLDAIVPVLARALTHWPGHPDILWFQAMVALAAWGQSGANYENDRSFSRQLMPKLAEAGPILGMPFGGGK